MPKTYLLRDIPAGLWTRVQRRAADDRLTLRGLVLILLERYADGRYEVISELEPRPRRRAPRRTGGQ